MRYELLQKPDFGMIKVTFEQSGEQLLAESSAMVAKDTPIQIKTQLQGGLAAAAKRKLLGGESLFQNTFTATAPGQTLFLASAPEGDVDVFNLSSEPLMLASGAFIACAPTVTLDTKWGGARGFFSGAGLFLLKATGTGPLFFGAYGGIHAVEVDARGYVCDTSHIVAFSAGLDFRVRKVGGLKSLFLSGEGLVCEFQGRGKLWVSTRSPDALAAFLHPFRPVQQQSNSSDD
jgi:uncharacterized protein (TIGR00266 family)